MPTNIHFKNTNQTHAVKVVSQNLVQKLKTKDGKATDTNQKWEDAGAYAVLAPSEQIDVWIGPGRRIIIEELPT